MHATIERAKPDAEHVDVLVIGAGLSGICAGYHLQTSCPWLTYAILESREAIGGTWDLFRYPGVRSDSDMPTLGYTFRPWTDEKAIADGPSILKYVRDTAAEFGIDEHIRFRHRVVSADWDTDEALWTLRVETAEGERTLTCRWLFGATGYYDYEAGHAPRFEGQEEFAGTIVHPQHWPDDLDYGAKRVVVIGSGATAVTLVPEMAKTAAHVTMLQRSPTWIVSMPSKDRIANWLHGKVGAKAAHGLTRWKNIAYTIYSYQLSQRLPNLVGGQLNKMAAAELPEGFDVETHLKPSYRPWDQRLCLVPDGDLFAAIKEGRADIVTDRIERFEADGIRLASGEKLEADVIVSATGLAIKVLGGIEMRVDGEPVDMSRTYSYKGALYSGIPNCSVALGYTNASWTLKCELVARYTCRILNHMAVEGHDYAVPRAPAPEMGTRTTFELSSGYLERARHLIPKQTDRGPWRQYQNYLLDMRLLRFGSVTDEMIFGRRGEREALKRSEANAELPEAEAA